MLHLQGEDEEARDKLPHDVGQGDAPARDEWGCSRQVCEAVAVERDGRQGAVHVVPFEHLSYFSDGMDENRSEMSN